MSINEILKSALELPIDERAVIVDVLTQSFNTTNDKTEKNWEDEVNKRLELLDSGELETISYEDFFNEN